MQFRGPTQRYSRKVGDKVHFHLVDCISHLIHMDMRSEGEILNSLIKLIGDTYFLILKSIDLITFSVFGDWVSVCFVWCEL